MRNYQLEHLNFPKTQKDFQLGRYQRGYDEAISESIKGMEAGNKNNNSQYIEIYFK